MLLERMAREVLRRYTTFVPTREQLEQLGQLEHRDTSSPSCFIPSLLSYNVVDEKGQFHRSLKPSIPSSSSSSSSTNLHVKSWAFIVKQWVVLRLVDHWSTPMIPCIQLIPKKKPNDVKEDLDLFMELSSKRGMTSDDFVFVEVKGLCSTWIECELYDLWKKHQQQEQIKLNS